MKTAQQNKVQATSTQNNVATSYKVFDIQGNLCKVNYNGVEYNGKLLNTSPTTHIKFDVYDVLAPATITLDNGKEVYTKTTQYNGVDNQTKFKEVLNKLQGQAFSFDKSTQAKPTTRNNNTNANTMQYIINNEALKKQYDALKFDFDQAKAHYEIAKTHFDNFMDDCKQKATQKQAQNTIEQLLKSGVLTSEQLNAIAQAQKQGGTK